MRGEILSEDMQNKIMNGYRVAGTLFRLMVEELEERFGKETAREIARAVVRKKGTTNRCPIVEAWQRSGLSPERIRELGGIYCWGDLAFAQVFEPDVQLEFDCRIAEGASYCKWIFTLPG